VIVGALPGCGGCSADRGKVSCEIRHGNVVQKTQLAVNGGWAQVGEGEGARRVEVRDGRVYSAGKDYGEVKAGDSILLDEGGRLLVNGQARDPR
jgi:hypothetical protein